MILYYICTVSKQCNNNHMTLSTPPSHTISFCPVGLATQFSGARFIRSDLSCPTSLLFSRKVVGIELIYWNVMISDNAFKPSAHAILNPTLSPRPI